MTLMAAGSATLVAAYSFGFTIIAGLLAIGIVVLVFDMRGRCRDYHNALHHLGRGRDPARVAKSYQFSWCGRVACQAAANAAGNPAGRAVEYYYRENGYRWFHIFPDNTFTLKSPFLTLRFWEITLRGNNRARQKLEEMEIEERLEENRSRNERADAGTSPPVRQAA